LKKLLMIMILAMLGACSKSEGDLTLSCHGRNVHSEKDGVLTAEDTTHKYQFKNGTTGDYQCQWSSKVIFCSSVEEKDGTRVRKQLIYDRSGEVFTETISTKQLNVDTPNKPIRVKNIFIGKCSKPIIG